MIYQWDSNTQTAVVTTEHTLSTMDFQGEAIQLIVDLSNMAAGDVLELRVYQKVLAGGTSRVAGLYTFYGAQPADALIFNSDKFMNEIDSEEGLKFTLKQTFGTGRNYAWKVLYALTDSSTIQNAIAGQIFIKKNVALNNFTFLMRQSSDHITPATGLTITATRSIDGAAFAACANAVSEVSNGVYKINLAAADMNGTVITLKFTATGADQRTITIVTQT